MKKSLYEVIDGRESWQYTISGGDIQLTVCNPGARVNSLKIGGVDIVLGFPTSADYLASGSFAGATIGRVGNRIAKGRFTLDGREYVLNINDGQNHLHGGPKGFDKYDFELTEGTDDRLVFRHFSPDGEENYPGNLDFTVTYAICGNELKITFSAESDADTLWNPTNHMYFNLDGEQSGDCLGNLLQIDSDFYTPVDEGLIPTGERRFVGDTPFDFRAAKPIGRDIGDEALKGVGGYDHNYILNGSAAAYAISPKTGIRMEYKHGYALPAVLFGRRAQSKQGQDAHIRQVQRFLSGAAVLPQRNQYARLRQANLKGGSEGAALHNL